MDIATFQKPGLYLLLPNGERIDLTRQEIESRARVMLEDPDRIPAHMRAAVDYKPCDICPDREAAEICHAVLTTVPFGYEVGHFMSYDKVTAVFRDEHSEVLIVRDTTMQQALQYISILSVIYYCEVGKKYSTFFEGVNPIMPQSHIANIVLQNLYLSCKGNLPALESTLNTMQEELMQTVRCQMKRLQLICKGDAFLNAFVNTENTTELMLLAVREQAAELADEAESL